jgi:hypothetical protein
MTSVADFYDAPKSSDEAVKKTGSVLTSDTSSGALAGTYTIFVGHVAPTDLASELDWLRRGYYLRTLARSFLVPQRALVREVAKLNAMRHAEEGWDGYRAQRPNTRTIERAISFLRQLAKAEIPLPAATVSSSGNAALFDSKENYYLDVEFEPNDRVGWLMHLRGGQEIEDDEPYDGSALPSRLTALLRSVCNA